VPQGWSVASPGIDGERETPGAPRLSAVSVLPQRRLLASYVGMAPIPTRAEEWTAIAALAEQVTPRARTTIIQLAWLWAALSAGERAPRVVRERSSPLRNVRLRIAPPRYQLISAHRATLSSMGSDRLTSRDDDPVDCCCLRLDPPLQYKSLICGKAIMENDSSRGPVN
jgi:hypothetical protein